MIFSSQLDIAVKTAKKAGNLLKKGFWEKYTISEKQGVHNLVTEYDLKSEKLIIEEIKKKYPSHSFLSEEKGSFGTSPYKWIIDPLDGTVNFAHHIPVFCVSIALKKEEEIILGVIYQPMTEELFIAEKNKGAYLNNKKINVSNTKNFKKTFLATGFPYNVYKNPEHCIDKFSDIIKQGLPVRRLGSAALDLAYVADARFDGYFEANLAPWDIAAGMILVQEAKGKISDWEGNPLSLTKKNHILATNKKIHKGFLRRWTRS